jgi:hypothetical protein
LYNFGVSGVCTFELTDPEYNEFGDNYNNPLVAVRVALPALDFRSKIPGMYE